MKSMLDAIVSRRSVRKWKPDVVSEDDIKDILEAAMNAPAAVNEQAWQFVVLSGRVLEEFVKINANTPKGAPVGILVCGDKKADKLGGFYVHDCCAPKEMQELAQTPPPAAVPEEGRFAAAHIEDKLRAQSLPTLDDLDAELRDRDAAIETLTSQVALERRERRARPPVAPETEPATADADAAERQPEVG